MSMKDAIFGTAAPTSHGGATYRDSIQAWLPVKNIIGGVVITKDNRFIKILEVLPVNFYLKSPAPRPISRISLPPTQHTSKLRRTV